MHVALFASLLGVATIIHWDKFNHGHVAFWLWAGLYFTTPFLVVGGWIANRRYEAPARSTERRLSSASQWVIGAIGALALVQGIVMFVTPDQVIKIWRWVVTPLTCRVIGGVFCLGAALAGPLVDPRWTSVRLMLQVEVFMLS